ncbi:hypothetical protein GCM10010253_19090 [Streptomyces badius]|uniref:Helix-turn-helix domain-containing protein n=1 Tax=Streptomyces badius TaxID=1941 RepID=A0ABQ2SZF3_STRBA|nr:hypothetical protein GCM10010253_19090 [Streptomyces badius]
MLRHVIAPSSGWTKASHTIVRDRRMNSNAKILILYVQGLPDSATNRPLGELAQKLDMKGRPYQQAKKQLVEHGYVHEWRGQREDGLWATDQLFTNTPLTSAEARAVWARLEQEAGRSPGVRYPTVGAPTPRSVGGYQPEEDHSDENTPHPPSEAERVANSDRNRDRVESTPALGPVAAPERTPEPTPASESAEASTERASGIEPAGAPVAGAPAKASPAQLAKAERLLLSLRHTRRDLLLGVKEARALAVEAVKWLEGGLPEGDLRQALLADPPEGGVRSAVGFLRHRLIQKCPVGPVIQLPSPPPPPVRELMACAGPGEEHVFRPLADEAECADCRRATAYASWMVDTDAYEFPEDMTWRQRVAAVRKADALRAAGGSPEGDVGDDGQMVAAGGGKGPDVADGGGTGHDLVDPGHREGGGETEGEPALGDAQL